MQILDPSIKTKPKALNKEYNVQKDTLTRISKSLDKFINSGTLPKFDEIKTLIEETNTLIKIEMTITYQNINSKKPLSSSFITTLLFNSSFKLIVRISILIFNSILKDSNNNFNLKPNKTDIVSIYQLLEEIILKNSMTESIGGILSDLNDNFILEIDLLTLNKVQLNFIFKEIFSFVMILLIKFPDHLFYITSDNSIKLALTNILGAFYFKYIYPVELKEINNLLDFSFEIKETESRFILKQLIDKESFIIEICKKDLYPFSKGKARYKYSNTTIKNSVKDKIKSWTQTIEIKRHNGLRNITRLVYTIEIILKDLKRIFGSLKECTICYCIMNRNELPNISCVSCKNLFHKSCIETWLDNHAQDRKCPYCRGEFY